MKRLLLLALLSTFGGLALVTPVMAQTGKRQAAPEDATVQLARWIKKYSDVQVEIPPEALRELEPVVAELRMIQVAVPDRRSEVFIALLDLGALAPRRTAAARKSAFTVSSARERASEQGFEALERAFDLDRKNELPAWIATTLLGQPDSHPPARRRAALDILAGRHAPSTLPALMTCARDERREIRDAAMNALVDWSDDTVHAFMLAQLARARSETNWVAARVVLEHFARHPPTRGGEGERAVFEFVRDDLLAVDWRVSTRAIKLLAVVDNELAVPALIEGLAVWIGRREHAANSSRRIEDELHRQLKTRSGKSIGPYPDRWAVWWKQRSTTPPNPADSDLDPQLTKAAFFGLRPVTDRVTFIIDRSTSMEAPFAKTGASRYAEAARQMAQFLRDLGPQTRFRVVLFDSALHIWKDQLQIANTTNVGAASAWISYQRPLGGTVLRTAVESVLRLRSDGTLDMRKLEEDTVIVLCDGATTDGPSWVEGLIERVR